MGFAIVVLAIIIIAVVSSFILVRVHRGLTRRGFKYAGIVSSIVFIISLVSLGLISILVFFMVVPFER